jgi:pyruvate carboxylase
MQKIKKILVANRSEIAIRVFRSSHELGIRTVAIYTYEDRYALHRFKADEAYLIGKKGEPIRAYLDIPAIVEVAKKVGADAIHPGYGFLSENPEFAAACREAGIIFVGPTTHTLNALGDKVSARKLAIAAGVPVLGGSDAITDATAGAKQAEELGYPIILKAAKGGGGRGMRVVREPGEFISQYEQARRESLTAFGSPDIFIEKFIERAQHIEVQLLGDQHGNLVHLFERDCSVQRRHQKVAEIAPAPNISSEIRTSLCEAAVAIGKEENYECAGTVEFLVDDDTGKFYFIEVNPRIQVEHTVTEEVTGIDVVRSQILVAQGHALTSDEVAIPPQDQLRTNGFALQCRVTTEDPANGFLPDYGRVDHYRSASGPGIRLDAGSAFSGAVVNPYYDSMLVKVTARGRTFAEACRRMERVLQEFRIRGVKTNIPFLIKLVTHEKFRTGECTTRFIDETPKLFDLPRRKDRATKLLTYIAEMIVNGNTLVKDRPVALRRSPAPVPATKFDAQPPRGFRNQFQEQGAEAFCKSLRDNPQLLITDTTFRDAHQSLLATRMRTYDLLKITPHYAQTVPNLFSMEMWGGATFDTSMRFLKESPWNRLTEMREAAPNILFQMLLRASNAVGYTNYPDNVVKAFVKEAADAGMDIFRVFDALNWQENMRVAMDAVLATGAICEACICYTGDILDSKRSKYDLKYYIKLAKELESMGAHILAIKDMAGLCKPAAAKILVEALKQEVGLPIHFHTHDTAGIQAGSILAAAEAGLEIADAAMAPLSGGTSQVNLNALVAALAFSDRATGLDPDAIDELADYWRATRDFYTPFESSVLPATADLYKHEMPGGQYTNLFQQARALGLADRWSEVCDIYADVNQLFGDIVKVTPTSKAVGDMALFMVANELTAEDVLSKDRDLAYPASVIDLIGGRMGQPPGGFPDEVKERILRETPEVEGRPGASMEPADFEATRTHLATLMHTSPSDRDVVTHILYPKVFEEFIAHQQTYSDTSKLPTPEFFYGQQPGEEIAVDIEPGKTLIIKFLTIGQPHPDGRRTVFFELNGQPRDVTVADQSLEPDVAAAVRADAGNPNHVGSTMPGMVVSVNVKVGDKVKAGQKLLSLEAMKMETHVGAEREGTVKEVYVKAGSQVDTGDLLLVIE